ncbi:hypothetical protein F5884DRAFT_756842 [Xylogone sp. PMI_703]|nr:hypothetical protein F5884DRAFT_756842 [Xylogone sp. PMI_703]
MQLKNIALLALVGTSQAYVVTLWQNPDCTGTSRSLNVYDNTCAIPGGDGWAAVTVEAYGGPHQRAGFFERAACADIAGVHEIDWWADGGSDTFLKGRCISMGGWVANAANSYIAQAVG